MNLAVVTTHFSSAGFFEPKRNLMRFLRQLTAEGVPVFVAELAYDEEAFFLDEHPNCFRFRIDRADTMWHKENLINLAVDRLPHQFDLVAWIDSDIWFERLDWYDAAVQGLQNWAVLQLFSEACWTSRDGRIVQSLPSSAVEKRFNAGSNHPGFAWAARRSLWTTGGGLCERAILGGGDAVMAAAWLSGEVPTWLGYPLWQDWTRRATEWALREGGCGSIDGAIVHEWHGHFKHRAYIERHSILRNVCLEEALIKRGDGMIAFSNTVPKEVRARIQLYFKERLEDGLNIQPV